MSGLNAATRQLNGTVRLDEEILAGFTEGLRGPCLTADDDGYDEARIIWNGLADKRPALIARCSGAADVIDAVNFAREHDVLVAVRGGGHNVAGNAMCDGGLVIDLSTMNGGRVDPVTATTMIQRTPAMARPAARSQTRDTGMAPPAAGAIWGRWSSPPAAPSGP